MPSRTVIITMIITGNIIINIITLHHNYFKTKRTVLEDKVKHCAGCQIQSEERNIAEPRTNTRKATEGQVEYGLPEGDHQ